MPEHNPYSEYSHLDLADYLPSATIAAIRSRSYIDFAKLLPDNVDDPLAENKQANFAEISGMKLGVTTKKGKAKKIDGIIKWVRAFAVWAFVYLDTNPHEGKGLFQYLHQILDGDRRFVWSVVYRYDKEVRLSMEKDPYRQMGPIDLCKWQNATSYVKNKRDSVQSFPRRNEKERVSQQTWKGGKDMAKSRQRSPLTCNDFNTGSCTRKFCKFTHLCNICGANNHAGVNCKANVFDKNT